MQKRCSVEARRSAFTELGTVGKLRPAEAEEARYPPQEEACTGCCMSFGMPMAGKVPHSPDGPACPEYQVSGPQGPSLDSEFPAM